MMKSGEQRNCGALGSSTTDFYALSETRHIVPSRALVPFSMQTPLFRAKIACIAFALALPVWIQPVAAQDDRPLIIMIHGRNQMRHTNERMDEMWYGSFRRGLTSLGLQNTVLPSDYTMVYYQDLYVKGSKPVCQGDAAFKNARLAQAEMRLLSATSRLELAEATRDEFAPDSSWAVVPRSSTTLDSLSISLETYASSVSSSLMQYHAALLQTAIAQAEVNQAQLDVAAASAAADAELAAQDAAWAASAPPPGFWDRLLEVVTAPIIEMSIAQKLVLRLVTTDTDRYIRDRVTACATRERLDAAFLRAGRRPVILVGHSMGTLVAYDRLYDFDGGSLGASRPPDIRRFVTLGSQLGVEGIVHRLVGTLRPLPVPRAVSSWVNLRGHDDWVSPRSLSGRYEARTLPPFEFQEYRVSTTVGDAHDIEGYLSNPAVARSITFAWCQAFRPGQRPAGCAQVSTDIRPGSEGGVRRMTAIDKETLP